MRIAVSDYDGTLHRNGGVADADRAAVERWRKAGNKFVVASGRDASSLALELRRRHVPFDFLICLNGASLFDGDARCVKNIKIDPEYLSRLLRHPAASASLHLMLSGGGSVKAYVKPDSWYPSLDVPYENIGLDEALAEQSLTAVSLGYHTHEESARWADLLNADLGAGIDAHHNNISIDITRAGVDKATGIADMLDIMGWEDADVTTVGDNANDIEMLKHYHGYAVENAADPVKAAAAGTIDSVGDMLDRMLADPSRSRSERRRLA